MVALLAVLASSGVFAGYQEGVVEQAAYDIHTNTFFVILSGTHHDEPSCAQQYNVDYWIVKDETSQGGKAQIAMLLGAKLSGKKVKIIGLNTCSEWHDGEDIRRVTIID